jgi:uncharacterized membrane protein
MRQFDLGARAFCRVFGLTLLALGIALAVARPAQADLRVCNETGSNRSVAIGYSKNKQWVSEGW